MQVAFKGMAPKLAHKAAYLCHAPLHYLIRRTADPRKELRGTASPGARRGEAVMRGLGSHVLISPFWFFGIHPAGITGPITMPLATMRRAANAEA